MVYDVVIVGGGPSGLSAALALGRARRRVLLCDSGVRRNAAAQRIHNFVTRDGTPPEEFRRIGREQLEEYSTVQVRADRIQGISGQRGSFRVSLGAEEALARRLLLCTGMVDELLPIEGFREHWGHSIFQCPYCHGYEVRDRRFGYLALPQHDSHFLPFVLKLRAWTREVVVFTSGAFSITEEARQKLERAGIRLETGPVARLVGRAGSLESVELTDGSRVPCDALFVHPPQRQVELVRSLGVELDDDGYVRVDPMKRETSVPGIYAAGDLTTRQQGAIFAAASGTQAAAMINLDVTTELALNGEL